MKNILFTLRKLKKNKASNSLGIAALVVGLVCVMYIFLWIADEVRHDRFHANLERIFVVHAYLEGGPEKITFGGCPPAVSTAIEAEMPEVEKTCRYIPAYSEMLVTSGSKRFMEGVAFADYSLFDIFSFPFIHGGSNSSDAEDQVILTESAAQRYFGKSNPVGEILQLNNKLDLMVSGVIQDIPSHSTIDFDMVIPLENLKMYYSNDNFLSTWYNNSFRTFGLLNRPEAFEAVASSVTNRIQQEMPESTNFLRAYLFKDGYLYERNHIRNIRIFGIIAILVLVSAILNFINLATAKSSKQAKETGLRKTIGASRWNVVRIIYSEVAIIGALAFVLAVLLAIVGLPLFNNTIGKNIDLSTLFAWIPISILIGVYVLTVFLAGSYPAFFLSSFSPIQTLSSNYQTTKGRGIFRNSMVVMMFAVSIVLLSSTLIIGKQTEYMQQMELGFEKDQLLYVKLQGKLGKHAETLREELKRSSGVLSGSVVSNLPNSIGNNGEGWSWEGKDPMFKPLVTNWRTDEHMLETFGATMAEGDYLRQQRQGIVINKTFARMIGWDSFVGRSLNGYGTEYPILGVMNDIHFNELSESVEPMVIGLGESWSQNYLVLKVAKTDVKETIDNIIAECEKIEPAFPVDYAFLDDEYNRQLKSEIVLGKLVGIFSIFTVIVLCLGLLGLVLFLTEQKIKEIGIRKCLGESVPSIVGRFVKLFLISGCLAGLVASPITWMVMNRWLEGYAFRTQITVWVFLVSGLIAVSIAVITVLWQSWRAATRNPVEALRYE